MSNPRLWSVLLACFWLALFVLTHIPAESIAPVAWYDEVAHVVAFALLALILATTWQLNAGELSIAQLGWAWFMLTLYAVLDEWTQGFVGRQPSVDDWIMDIIGAGFGLALFAWLRQWIRRPRNQ